MSVSSELIFAGLTLASGFRRRARWMSAVMAAVWLTAADWDLFLQWLPVWTGLPVAIAMVVASGAWYQLVLRERRAATPPDSWRQRKKRGR